MSFSWLPPHFHGAGCLSLSLHVVRRDSAFHRNPPPFTAFHCGAAVAIAGPAARTANAGMTAVLPRVPSHRHVALALPPSGSEECEVADSEISDSEISETDTCYYTCGRLGPLDGLKPLAEIGFRRLQVSHCLFRSFPFVSVRFPMRFHDLSPF